MSRHSVIIMAFCAALVVMNACSNMTKRASGEENANVLSMMVIERSSFERDFQKSCTHTRECTAPLACFGGQCIVPPAITGKIEPETPELKFTTKTGTGSVRVEIENDEYLMSRGMMMRRYCQPGWGMLFAYPEEGKRAFWMHNTYIALDMVFIRADGSVSNVVSNAEPLNDVPRYLSTDRVKYVLELPAGDAGKYGIVSGSQFDLSSVK
ncbi:MAG: DUF192 domain-containing protein [Proteobacteria bacterium]|nr:DUF192 domain-containing protein [Pseudomonadota bacterium]